MTLGTKAATSTPRMPTGSDSGGLKLLQVSAGKQREGASRGRESGRNNLDIKELWLFDMYDVGKRI